MAATTIRLNVDTSQAKSQVDSMSESLKSMTEQLQEATEAGNWHDAANITMALNNLQQAQKQQMMLANKDIALQQQSSNNFGNSMVNTANTASGAVQTLASGNYAGAAISATRGMGNSLRGYGKDLSGKEGMGGLGSTLSALGIAGIIAGAAGATGNALSGKYEEALHGMTGYNKLFKGVGADNTKQELYWHNIANEAAKNTNLTTDELLQFSKDYAKYGSKDGLKVMNDAKKAALQAYGTGADITNIQNLQGLSRRYGDNSDVSKTAYGGLLSSGMQKGQYDEFLNSLQRVMEDGIAKGYMKSAAEIATNLTMFARLSGNNPMWQGEQGTNRLLKMNSALANASNMQSTSDMLVMGAAKNVMDSYGNKKSKDKVLGGVGRYTGTYLDYQMLTEQGTNPELFASIGESVKQAFGDDTASRVETYKQIYGLNTIGARDVDLMYQKLGKDGYSEEQFKNNVKAITENTEYQSNETKMQNVLNDLNHALVGFGQKAFEVKISGFDKLEDITGGIYKWLIKDDMSKIEKGVIQSLYSGFGGNEGNTGTGDSYYNVISNAILKNKNKFKSSLDWLGSLSPKQRQSIDANNLLNIRDPDKWIEGVEELKKNGIPTLGGVSNNDLDTALSNLTSKEYKVFTDGKYEKVNWQAISLANDLLNENQGEKQDSLDKWIKESLKGRFKSKSEVENFLNSDSAIGFRNMYVNTFDGNNKIQNDSIDYIKNALKSAMSNFSSTTLLEINKNIAMLREDLKNLTITMS